MNKNDLVWNRTRCNCESMKGSGCFEGRSLGACLKKLEEKVMVLNDMAIEAHAILQRNVHRPERGFRFFLLVKND